ncbi:LLM class flavin-dependent oxidoreductase [Nonomuraea sp. MG754425]|uniref:LLM class flavin-dependent oxidoreductase n=1 Tax=Nonomuraea sp. MG754425 TaxID=2570319 RepID=UPI001F31E1FE|nr:LLM class flavin-dependent oxidoreductase [Nonomuraea sp. MG754425]
MLRLLWEGDEKGVGFDGEFFGFESVTSYPKPYGVTHLPIHVGGSSRAAARRAGLRGDGYFPGGALTDEERQSQWELVRSVAAEAGRDAATLEYTRWGSLAMSAEQVEELAAAGVTRLVLNPTTMEPEGRREQMSAFAERFALGRS